MKTKHTLTSIIITFILAASLLLSGCGSQSGQSTNAAASTEAVSVQATAQAIAGTGNQGASAAASTAAASAGTAAAQTDSQNTAAVSDLFTERDLTQTADLSSAKTLTLTSGQNLTISEAGVYILSGSAENATLIIQAGDEDKVQLVLDGITITNTNQPCILVENADKVFITSAQGSENTLTVSGAFSGEEDAAVFSRDDLVLNGLGSVTVTSSKDGIRSNDDLKLTGGSWNIQTTGSALKAHEGIYAWDGAYTLTAGSDGLHAENNDDDTVGEIRIEGGTFTIQAGDDGIHATTSLTVNGGTLTITAGEGMEATQLFLNNGSISIQATDDGINAGQKSSALSIKIEINGGEISIVMGPGDTDAIDSNGDLAITGGVIQISAQSPFDYDGQGSLTGGTVMVNGTQISSLSNQMMGGPMGGGWGGQPGGQGGQPGGQGGQPGGQGGGPGGGRRR